MRNSKDLNIAWPTRCKYAKEVNPSLNLSIINAICLIVDKAMIFLMSSSIVAQIPDAIRVSPLSIIKTKFSSLNMEING